MTDQAHPVITYHYVCSTCGLTVGPYNFGHKNIECDNCGDGLLNAERQRDFMTANEWENLEPRIIKPGRILGKRTLHRFRKCEACQGVGEGCTTCEGAGLMKVCPQCRRDKPAFTKYYRPNLCSQYGLFYVCRICMNDKGKKSK